MVTPFSFIFITVLVTPICYSYDILQNNIFNSRTYNASVKTGDIIIFPGWLEHQALPNEDESPRIILGTNYFVTGKLGRYENKDLISI